MPSELNIDNLEKGVSPLSYVNSDGKNDLEIFFSNDQKKDTVKIFKVTKDDVIDCNKYNYYYTKYMGKFGQPYFVTKIDSIFGCKSAVEGTSGDVYRVERKNRPMGEKLKSGVTGFFNRPATGEATPTNPAATGGRKSRKQRNSKNQRNSRKQRKSRKSRR
jgi:hypothetical protein